MVSLRTALTPEERVAGWKLGAYATLAEHGIRPSQASTVMKTAASGPIMGPISRGASLLSPVSLSKGVAAVALLTGIPMGIVAHMFSQRANAVRNKEQDLTSQADYYRNASGQLEAGIAASN